MKRLDIAMTAALRPGIVNETLHSLHKNLIWDGPVRLIVDIAPVGEPDVSQTQIVHIINRYFSDRIVRIQKESLQAEALKWTWQHTTSPFFLQWEDDWVLHQPLEIQPILDFAKQGDRVGMVYFDRKEKPVRTHPGYQGKFRYIHSGFWERTREKSLAGPPALLRKEYADEVLTIVDGTRCLDIISSEAPAQKILAEWGLYVYTGVSGELVKDIGKPWKEKMGFFRDKRTSKGVLWVKK